MTEQKTMPTREIYGDILRIIAAFSVVFQHTASSAWYSLNPTQNSWLVLNFFNSSARFGVGIFVMLSGAFLLSPEKNYSPEQILKTKVPYLLKLIVFWVIFYGIFQLFIQGFSWKEFLTVPLLAFTKPQTHLWFLYMLAGLYLFTPALRIFTTHESEKMLRLTLIMLVIFGMCVPTISHLIKRFADIQVYSLLTIQGTTSYLAYYLAGLYFSHFSISNRSKKWIYAFAFLSFIISFIGSTYLSLVRNSPDEFFLGNMRPTNFIMVVAIFIFFKDFSDKLNVSSKFITLCSRTTLGIYLIHPVFLKIFYGLKLQLISPTPWLNVPLTAVSIFLLSFIFVFILKKVPFLKKFL